MPTARRRSPLLRWAGLILTLLILAVYAANLPFYSGSSLGPNWRWRMEHGRFLVARSSVESRESFYIAPNSEGLRFRPDWRFTAGDWRVNIPLWIPFLLVAGATAAAWRPRRRAGCPRCGYDMTGLPAAAVCPECGLAPADSASGGR